LNYLSVAAVPSFVDRNLSSRTEKFTQAGSLRSLASVRRHQPEFKVAFWIETSFRRPSSNTAPQRSPNLNIRSAQRSPSRLTLHLVPVRWTPVCKLTVRCRSPASRMLSHSYANAKHSRIDGW